MTEVGGSETSLDFEYRQLAHVLSQVISMYPTTTMRAYTQGMYAIDGAPTSLYVSPSASGSGIFTMTLDGDTESLPLNGILAFRTGEGTVFDEHMSFLEPPSPLPSGWDTDVIAAVRDYLSVGDEIEIYWGIGNNTAGFVYRNEFGILTVTADMDGNDPYFILPTGSLIILSSAETAKSANENAETEKAEAVLKKRGLIRFE